jgi:uncharacterized protein
MKTKFGAAVLQVKKLTDAGTFEGYGSIFGNKDSYGDVVERGAFADSLAAHAERGSRPKMFWQHDMHQPIGSWTEIKEDETGLWVSGRLNMEVQRGREAYALLKAEDIDGLSIGYHTIRAERDDEQKVLRLKELHLVEVSIVSVGANDRALVDTVKTAEIANLRDRLAAGDRLTEREWEALFKNMGLSNSEAERVVRVHGLKVGQGDPDAPTDGDDFAAALWAAMRDAPIIDNTGE